MNSLARMLINGLALVGAHEIYKEYQLRKTSSPGNDQTATKFNDRPNRPY